MMTTPARSTLDCSHPITDSVRKHKDGSVLLSITEDRVCKLNGVGALTWMVLEDSSANWTLHEIACALEAQFEAINSEGELLYDVSREQLEADTARFLNRMTQMGLIAVTTNSSGQEIYSIRDGVTGTTSAKGRSVNNAVPLSELQDSENEIKVSKRETLGAFVGLLAFDLLLKFGGFQSLIKRVGSWPTAEPTTRDPDICRRVRATVDRAQMYYPRKAMCLQHSAVVTCLLRRRGVAAEMVLAAQEFPPKAHAWTEVAGQVVNDKNSVKSEYLVLKRL